MVAFVKRIGDPIASMNASRSITPAGQKWLNVPLYIATERGPCAARMCASACPTPSSATRCETGSNVPSAPRRSGCSTRAGS